MSGGTRAFVDSKLQARSIMVFGKSYDPDCHQAKRILERYYLPESKSVIPTDRSTGFRVDSYEWLDIERRQDCKQIETYLHFLSGADRREVSASLQ